MGQHLQLYASKHIPIEKVASWCRYRAHDLTEMPSKDDDYVASCMRQAGLPEFSGENICDNMEHGSKSAVVMFDFLVWRARVIDAELISEVCRMNEVTNHPSDHMIDWLCKHYGQVVWGDNDGV